MGDESALPGRHVAGEEVEPGQLQPLAPQSAEELVDLGLVGER